MTIVTKLLRKQIISFTRRNKENYAYNDHLINFYAKSNKKSIAKYYCYFIFIFIFILLLLYRQCRVSNRWIILEDIKRETSCLIK